MTASVLAGLPPLSDAEFREFRDLVHREAGIFLGPSKKALLVGRLGRRLRAVGAASFAQYYERIHRDAVERVEMLNALCTHETHFFREPRQFEFLESVVYPQWAAEAAAGRRARTIRAWSAACSTGEEPYSLAMSLLSHLPREAGWSIEILASDLSTQALTRAGAGLWPIDKATEISEPLRKRFMWRGVGSQEGRMRAGEELRSVLRFERINLSDPDDLPRGPFDLLFCRNVLIYFEAASKPAVIGRLLDRLAPSGLLLLGHAESLSGFGERARSVGPTVYALNARPK
jgi:chemotaxis protein methyltransferase CheR